MREEFGGGRARKRLIYSALLLIAACFQSAYAAPAGGGGSFEHALIDSSLSGYVVDGYFADWPPEFQDVAGDAQLEAVSIAMSADSAIVRAWSLDAQTDAKAPVFRMLGSARLPDAPALERPLHLHWARPLAGAKEMLFAVGPSGAWLLSPDFSAGAFRIARIVEAPTRMFAQTAPPISDAFPIAFDIDNDGGAEVYLHSETGHEFWKREADGKYARIALPQSPEKNAPTDTGPFQFGTFLNKPEPALAGRQPVGFSYTAVERLTHDGIQFQDVNRDGLIDLLWPGKKRWAAHQTPGARFDAPAPLPAPDFRWLPDANIVGPLDFDGDSAPDYLGMHSIFSLDDPRTTLGIHYGKWGPAPETGPGKRSMISTRDPSGLVWVGDLNNDGLDDLCLTYFSYLISSAGDLIDYFLQDDAKFTLRFFFGKKGVGISENDADDSIEIKAKTATFSYPLAPPVDLSSDFNGDGLKDLLIRRSENLVELHLQDPSKHTFARREAQSFEITKGAPVAILDINADGAADVIDAGKPEGQISIYLSRKK